MRSCAGARVRVIRWLVSKKLIWCVLAVHVLPRLGVLRYYNEFPWGGGGAMGSTGGFNV